MKSVTPSRRSRRNNERGYALLLVFLMASAVGLMLYRQMPREAFESERDKEQMLIDRGEQYKRAIYLYYVSNNRQWPSKIEDLENTNNKRYLRRRYINPYTGKDEWRLVHTNGAFLTDSLVTPPPAQATPGAGGLTAGAGGPLGNPSALVASNADPNAPPEVNSQVQRRPSDRNLVQNSDFQNPPGGPSGPGNDPGYQPFNPASLPPISLYPNGYNAPPTNVPGVNIPGGNGPGVQPGFSLPGQQFNPGFNQPVNQPGVNQPGVNQPGFNPGVNQPGFNPGVPPGVPGFTVPGTNSPITTPGVNPPNLNPPNFNPSNFNQNPNQPGNLQTVNPGFPTQFPGQPVPPQDPNQPAVPGNFPGFGGTPGAGVPGTPGAAPNQALNVINNLLTTPRQPPAGLGQAPATGGGGLAGVASSYKGASIKSYGDRTKYQEWEFVFQLNAQGNALQAPQGLGPNGQPPGGPTTPGVPPQPGVGPKTQ
jgi:hypothetical protein